jgi:hypothetical protein
MQRQEKSTSVLVSSAKSFTCFKGIPHSQSTRLSKHFTMSPLTFNQFNNVFYIRAGGDATVMHYGDEYGSIYLEQGLPPDATVVVKIDNPDLRSNWPGLSGIMVRNHIDQPGKPGAYILLRSSPAAGTYLDWSGEDSGVVNHRAEAEGFTIWPHWLKLRR